MKEEKKEGRKATRTAIEISEPEVSNIIGTIPDWVSGQLIRNGPAKWNLKHCAMNHLFDGYNMITKFEIRGGNIGTVLYSSKFLQSEAFKKAEAVQKPVISEYSTKSSCVDSKKSVISRMISTFIPEQTDNCPFICTTGMGKNPIVIGDTGFMFELDPSSLDCISRHDPVKEFGVHCQSSHPLVDNDGYTYNLGISILSGAKWNVLKFPPSSKLKTTKECIKKYEILTSFPCRNKTLIPWLHSFGMSKNYIICIDQPSYFNATKILGCIFSKGFCPKDVNEWRPEYKNRFYYINKSTGKVVKTEILSKETFFFYHILNCYEQDDHIVVDVFCMPNFKLIENQTMENFRTGYKGCDKESPTLQRYVIPLIASEIKNCPENCNLVTIKTTIARAYKAENKITLEPEILSDNRMEFPTFNKKFSGLPLRYIWASGAFAPSSTHQHKIFKFDLQTKKLITWRGKDFQFVGEPILLTPNNNNNNCLNNCQEGVINCPNNCQEGVIVSVVTNMEDFENEKDFILFLDAQTLTELGRAYFKADIPGAMHGIFISDY